MASKYSERLMALFAGHDDAHGTHGEPVASAAKGGKREIKKTARTLRGGPTPELWEAHLAGVKPLGVVPIRKDQTCVWGAVDVDRYDLNLGDVYDMVEKRKIPFVLCRTKSGGVHAYLFLKEPAPASELRERLKDLAASLGWGDCEIFPKQSEILEEQGDLGNWINMPYLGGDKTERYAFKKGGLPMTLAEFLARAEESRTTVAALGKIKKVKLKDDTLDDGPPCLQHLAAVGFPEGTRNNGLFGLGVFCQKKYGDEWADKLRVFNQRFMAPPLPEDEVEGLVESLSKKEYGYKCKDQPCVSYCNASLCRTRDYGVSGGADYPELTGIAKLDIDPPIYFLDVSERRIELSLGELLNYREFHAKAYAALNQCFGLMKQDAWLRMVAEVTDSKLVVIEAPREASTLGHFMELLEEFLTNRYRGDSKEDLLLGKPFLDEETGRYYFRLHDLMKHLEREGFRKWGRNVVAQRLREMGGTHFFNIKGKGVSVYWVGSDAVQQTPEADLPESRRDPI